jgi:hypothetical protein
MNSLSKSNCSEFLSRFYSFNDGVLREIEVSYMDNGRRNVSALIATRDTKENQNDGWVCVRMVISQVADFCFSENAKSSAQVLSQGIHILWFNDSIGIEFGHFIDCPGSLAELMSSSCFAIGLSLEWAVEPYK